MKKQFLAAALSCAVFAMASLPSAMAASGSASGIVSSSGDGITFTDPAGTGYAIVGTSTEATLAGDVEECYVDTSTISGSSKYFTVTDTDNVSGHYITVATSDENFSVGAGGSTIPTTALELTMEGGMSISECPTSSEQVAADIIEKVAGHADADVTSLSMSTSAYESTSDVAYLGLSTTPATLVTSIASEAFQYKFRIGAVKMTYPQFAKPGTYSTTIVATYNASST